MITASPYTPKYVANLVSSYKTSGSHRTQNETSTFAGFLYVHADSDSY
jgi:hypothetical protein